MKPNFTYRVVEANEDASKAVIEKGNITVRFTLTDHQSSIADMEKTLRELNAKYNHDKLIKENIEEHHPWVLELDEMKRHTVYMYLEACEVVKQYEPKIKEFEDALATDKDEVEFIKSTILNDNTKTA